MVQPQNRKEAIEEFIKMVNIDKDQWFILTPNEPG